MTRLLTRDQIEFIEGSINSEIREQEARGDTEDWMELRAHALNEFRSQYTRDGRGNWNKELEGEVGIQIDDLLARKQLKEA